MKLRSLIFSVFILIGVLTLAHSAYLASKALHSITWSPATAVVNALNFKVHERFGTKPTLYEVKIRYTYRVGKKTYVGDKIAVGYGRNNFEKHHELYEILKSAKTIEVYYNPLNPSKAVVVKGITDSIFFRIMFTLVWNSSVVSFFMPFIFYKENEINKRFFEEAY